MLALFFVVVIDLIGFGMVIPLLPLLGEAVGATPLDVGLLMASFSACQFLSAPLWGRWSDKVGRKPVLLLGLAGSVLSYLAMAMASSFTMLLLTRAAAGLMAGNIGAAFAYAADVSSAEKRTKAMGVVGAAFGLGFIGGPALGGLLAGNGRTLADFGPPALAAALLSAAALILGAFTLKQIIPAAPRERNGLLSALRTPGLIFPFAAIFITTFAFAGMESTFALWSERALNWGPKENGYMFAFMGLVSALVQGGATHRLAGRLGLWVTAALGSVVLAAGMIAALYADDLRSLLLPAAAMALGFGLVSPTLNSALSFAAKTGGTGVAMGVGRSVATAARAFGPVVAGLLFGLAGKEAPFIAGALLLAGFALAVWVRSVRNGATD